MSGYKFLIDEGDVFAVMVDRVVIPKMKTLGSRFWDEIWNLQYFADHNLYDISGRSEITFDEYNEIFSCLKAAKI